METLDYPSWRWGLSLIALTMAFHAAAVVQLMGALESVNGMLLFGVSTAWLFTVAQGHWFMIAEQVAPRKS